TKERKLWDNVRSRRSPTNYDEADFDSFHRNKRVDNEKRMRQDIVHDSICEQDADLKEEQEEDGDDRDICNTPKYGKQQNMGLGVLLHNTSTQVMRERPLTVSFEKKS
ncbi:hypothetical protein Tco_1149873, partial [Tanacetum coccineum]